MPDTHARAATPRRGEPIRYRPMLRFDSISLLVAGLLLTAVAMAIVTLRRPRFPVTGLTLIGFALLLLAAAAGGPYWRRPVEREVTVMVDLSPSTRGAGYRDPARLDRRVQQLLGSVPHRTIYFADRHDLASPAPGPLVDMPSSLTRFEPPAAAAVLLFSDGRFELPATDPPTYAVVDPPLQSAADAAVVKLEVRDGDAVAMVRNSGPQRELFFEGTAGSRAVMVPTGSLVIRRPLLSDSKLIAARFVPGDAWPENDGLTLVVPPPKVSERWWVGRGPAPNEGWRLVDPAALPGDAPAYLRPAVIVLQNVAATDLLAPQQQRLTQYVRDMGGAVVILGGDRAFAAGDYPGTPLESLSPLASSPPEPVAHWVLLTDGSGSMGESVGSGPAAPTRWDLATAAVLKLLPELPPEDAVTIGSFSDVVRWWTGGKTARETAAMPLAPAGLSPQGPTNLEPALNQLADATIPGRPTHLLLLTDAEARIEHPADLAKKLKTKHIRLHLLMIAGEGSGSGLAALRLIVSTTNGSLVAQADPSRWVSSLRELMRGARPQSLFNEPTHVTFAGTLKGLPPRDEFPWNRTWLKPRATLLAEADLREEHVPMAARWMVGSGTVLAAAFAASADEAEAMARGIATPPRDPRFSVRWDIGAVLSVDVDAVQTNRWMNGVGLRLDLEPATGGGEESLSYAVAQSGPGRYQLRIGAPAAPSFATLRTSDGLVLDRIAVAGRYAPEFEAIGNDLEALRELAGRTGGNVVAPSQVTPIDFHWPRRDVALESWLAMAAALFIAMAVGVWKFSG